MGRITLVSLVLFSGIILLCSAQSLQQQAAAARAKCEQGLRDKGCSGITSSCNVNQYNFNCKCNAASCPTGSGGGSGGRYTQSQLNAIRNNQEFRTNGCGPGGPTPCPSGYCCGPASPGSYDNMRICYPPGSPC